jgi:threonylcarbamoyladenosine tRNA methylthiotransferase CDKAL1
VTAGKTAPEQEACHRSDLLDRLCNRSVFIETYGCRYNFGDTAKLAEILKHMGSTIVDEPEEADVVIINTCTVVGPTERRMLRRLSIFRDRDLFVTGCMPVVQREAVFAVCTPTIIPPDLIHNLYRSIRTVEGGSVGIVQIAQGCVGKCSYCLTRFARGPLKSFSEDEILAQIRAFVKAGTTEIQITAQDVGAWGMDNSRTFPELLTAIGKVMGKHMIRIGMMNPATVKANTGALVEAYRSETIYKFLHLPVQSGSDAVLQRMGRDYTVAEFEEIVAAFRKRYPAITIATDVIVGFPGETEEDFSETIELIRRIRPHKVNVTRYSRRPYTCITTERDFPDHIKKDRSRILNAVAEEVYTSINTGCIGNVVPFMVTETLREGSVLARSPVYTGIVLREALPVGLRGYAILKKDRKYFFIGERVHGAT